MSDALRFNMGKTEFTRLYVPALEAEAKVFMKGAQKYPDSNDGTPNWHRLWGEATNKTVCDSALRHLFAILSGEDYDKETGLPHAAHIRCNMAMLIKYLEDNKEVCSTEYDRYVHNEKRLAPLPSGSYIREKT